MTRKILLAKNFGDRKLVKVVVDDSIPKTVHYPYFDAATGSEVPHLTEPTAERAASFSEEHGRAPQPHEYCQGCRYNWDVRDFMWTGQELKKQNAAGVWIDKTDADLQGEIRAILDGEAAAPAVRSMAIEGTTL